MLVAAMLTPVVAGEMTVSWTWEEAHVVFHIAAPTTGWVAVGVNDRDDLANSRLLMAAVRDGVAVAEEHVPRPPRHPKVADLTVRAASEAEGWTRVSLAMPREPSRADAPRLAPGDRVWLTLAWSHDDDFDHHSAMRTARWVRLADPQGT